MPWAHRCRLLASLLIIGLVQRLSPASRAEEPQWLKLDGLPEPSVGVEIEGSHETQKVSGSKSTYDQISVTPLVGLETKGSIYHPNLCTFNLTGEMGWGWENTTTESSGSTQDQNYNSDVRRYLAQVNFLQQKPYNANFFATQDHTYQNFGSFNTMTVDSTRYGGGVNYFNDNFTLSADAGYWDQQNSGVTGYSEIAQTYYNLTAYHYRQFGQTTFTSRGSHYENTLNQGGTQTSDSIGVGLSDSETIGARRNITLTTGASYAEAQYAGQDLTTIAANENANITHTANLDSYGTVNFNHYDYQLSTDNRIQGLYGVRHQLFESLTSGADAHGYYEENDTSGTGTAKYDSYGLGGSENYNKRLGSWGRLNIGLGMIGDHVDQDNLSGVLTAFNELHVLPLTVQPVFLDHPNVIQSDVIVLGPGGAPTTEGVDYQLTTVGELTGITLIPSSAVLHPGDVIHVTYEYESPGSASYETLNGYAQIRLDFHDKYGVYARLNWMDNNAPPEVTAQTLTDWIFGADYTVPWLRAGAEYEDYNSDYATYQVWRAFQNFSFKPSNNSSLGLIFNESYYEYSDGNSQTTYQMFSHYQVQFAAQLSWFAEAGAIYQDVFGSEQWTGTGRTGLSWSRGKLTLKTGVDFNDQHTGSGQYSQEFMNIHYYFYLKRIF